MTNPDQPTDSPDGPFRLGRRQLLQTGALTVTLGAVLAACGSDEEGEPGRVGYAPAATPLPTVVVDDAVLMRTATSIELMIVDVYTTIGESGVLDETALRLLDRLIEDHKAAAAKTAALSVEAGGEAYECANSWYMDRVVPPIFRNIDGDEAAGIPPTDDPKRDYLAVVNAFESMDAAMYQGFMPMLTVPKVRAEVIGIGAVSARHAAATAIVSTGAPEGYVTPELLGLEVKPGEDGIVPLWAIPTQFASLAPVQLTIGAASDAGTRFTTSIDTPADNSYVYAGQTCDDTSA